MRVDMRVVWDMCLCLKIFFLTYVVGFIFFKLIHVLPSFQKKYPVDFDDESKIGDVRYDDITIKVTLF